jgi:alpha/beta superfamily hydrolase
MVESAPPPLAARVVPVPRERALEILTDDGYQLDARLVVPEGASRGVVIAHPHPLYGGSMDDPLTAALARVLVEHGAATLRFNFRGVGGSEGRHGGGVPEIGDALTAVSTLAAHVPTVSVVGYSFGSWVALQAARAHRASIDRIALVAPAMTILAYDTVRLGGSRFERPIAMVLGDRDGFSDPARARVLAARIGASIAVLSGEDHFFSRSRRRVAELVAPFLLGVRDRIDEGDLA